ncbi:MAG: DUF177 domain-containing protein [Crocinitomicaceae bacterium]|nr:DUF177 domain-containing protein [Crocinitomicaceae bacterium]
MSDKEYQIPFVGLKLGIHDFEFEITDRFFENIEYSIVQKGNVKVHFSLEKKETMMIGNYQLEGVVGTTCDRCTDPIDVQIEGEYRLIYKFDNEDTDDETLIVVFPEEFEINIKQSILEFISVSLPSRTMHEKGDCNEEMLDLLNEYTINSEPIGDEDVEDEDWDDEDNEDEESEEENDYVDPRWEALKKLKGDSK